MKQIEIMKIKAEIKILSANMLLTLKNNIRENEELAVELINSDYKSMNTYYHIAICYHKARALSSTMFDLFGYGYTILTDDDIIKITECISTLEVTTSCYEITDNN